MFSCFIRFLRYSQVFSPAAASTQSGPTQTNRCRVSLPTPNFWAITGGGSCSGFAIVAIVAVRDSRAWEIDPPPRRRGRKRNDPASFSRLSLRPRRLRGEFVSFPAEVRRLFARGLRGDGVGGRVALGQLERYPERRTAGPS